MTDITTNGENPNSPFLWERYGISRDDCSAIISQHIANTRKLDSAEDKVRRARDLVELLMAAAEGCTDDHSLSLRTLEQLDRVRSLLKSAQKKIDKYSDEQKIREIESWKSGGAS